MLMDAHIGHTPPFWITGAKSSQNSSPLNFLPEVDGGLGRRKLHHDDLEQLLTDASYEDVRYKIHDSDRHVAGIQFSSLFYIHYAFNAAINYVIYNTVLKTGEKNELKNV